MSAVLTNDGVDAMAQVFLGKRAYNALELILFVNNYSIVVTTTPANLTICGCPGYAPAAFTPANWTGSSVGGVATYAYPVITFNLTGNNGGETVYGYAIRDTVANKILWGETVSTPFPVPANGGQVSVTPQWIDQQG